MSMMWIIAGIFLILSIILLTGKGGFLVAGYNTASPERKAKTDGKKLSKITGVTMLLITIILVVMAMLGNKIPPNLEYVFPILILVIAIADIILANTICRNKDYEETEINDSMRNNSKKMQAYSGIFTVIVLFIVAIIMFTGKVDIKTNDSKIIIKTSYYSDDSIKFDEIEDIEYRENFKVGSKSAGYNSYKLDMGRFKNSEFNYYTIYINRKCKAYIVITTKDDTIVINEQTVSDTKKLFEKINEKIK